MNNASDQELESHAIQLADTRPSMIWLPLVGEIPIVLGAFIFIIFGCAYVLFGWRWALGFPAVWFGVSRLIALDYHAITKMERYLNTSAWNLDGRDYGGYSVSPFTIRTNKEKGMQ